MAWLSCCRTDHSPHCVGICWTRECSIFQLHRGPRDVLEYLAGLVRFSSKRYLGHSPAGGAMVVALLIMIGRHRNGQSSGGSRRRAACGGHFQSRTPDHPRAKASASIPQDRSRNRRQCHFGAGAPAYLRRCFGELCSQRKPRGSDAYRSEKSGSTFTPEFRVVSRPAEPWASAQDAGSKRLIVVGQGLAVAAAFTIALLAPAGALPHRTVLFIAGVAAIIVGGLLRRHCKRMLGASFTGAVIVRPEQAVVERGVYRYVRHPSYTAGVILFWAWGSRWPTGSVS